MFKIEQNKYKNIKNTMDKPQRVEDIRKKKKEGLEGVGKRWTEEEEKQMMEEIKTLPVDEVAKLHKRMSGGIRARLCMVAARMLREGKTMDEAMLATKQSKDDIEEFIKKNGDGSKTKPTPTAKELEEKLQKKQVKSAKLEELELTIIEMKKQLDRMEQLILQIQLKL